MANTIIIMKGPRPSSVSENYLPIADVAVADAKHGTYDVYWRPVNGSGTPLASATLISGQEIYTDQGVGQLAFPGAEGFGRFATGGRGGTLYRVTNTNASGSGSLREALEASGTRTIVFDVSGTIDLGASRARVTSGNFTLAGQTAPGDGVQIKGGHVNMRSGSDIIIRHTRFRTGIGTQFPESSSAIQVAGNDGHMTNIIYDHCEAMFDTDENTEISNGSNITMQDCIFALSLHCSGARMDAEPCHGKNMLVSTNATNITTLRTILAHSNDRHPLSNTSVTTYQEYVNNVYLPGVGGIAMGSYAANFGIQNIQVINCWHLEGGLSNDPPQRLLGGRTYSSQSGIHLKGNIHPVWDPTGTNQAGLQSGSDPAFSPSPLAGASWIDEADTLTAAQALTHAQTAGATRPAIDALTASVHADVLNDIGRSIDNVSEVGGYPTLTGSHPSGYDDDNDGINDLWANRAGMDGLKTPTTIHKNGWDYRENFLNDLANDYETNGSYVFLKLFGSLPSGTTDVEIYIEPVGDPFDSGAPKSTIAVGNLKA